jgi:mannosyltransferase
LTASSWAPLLRARNNEVKEGISQRTLVIAIGALTIVAAILRVVGLDRGLWFDEIVTLVESVRLPLGRIVTTFPGTNNHPLYTLLAHVSVGVFGEHVWSLRLPAMIFGVAAVPLIYWLGASMTTRLEGVLATALLATSYHHVWFSQNARGYTLLLCCSLLSTLLMVRLAEDPRPRIAVAYGLTIAIGLYTHITMAFVPVAHAATWATVIWSRTEPVQRRQAVRVGFLAVFVAVAATLLLYVPFARDFYRSLSTVPRADAAGASASRAFADALSGLRIGVGTLGVLAGALLALLGALSYVRQDRTAAMLLMLPGALAFGILLATNSPMRPRFFFAFLGFAIFIVVRGAAEMGRLAARQWAALDQGAARATAAMVLVGAMVAVSLNSLRYNYAYPKQDFEGARAFIDHQRAASDVVATGGLATYPFLHYYGLPWVAVDRTNDLEVLRERSSRIWLIYAFPQYMDAALVATLQRDCIPQRVLHGTLGGGDLTVCTVDTGLPHDR